MAVPTLYLFDRVSSRKVSPLDRRGGWHSARFTYGRNLNRYTRTVLEDEVFTALYGWGKGIPVEDDEGTRRTGTPGGSPSIP